MLGILRQELHLLNVRGVQVKEVAKDMTKFSPRRIHDCLARENILPECRKPGA